MFEGEYDLTFEEEAQIEQPANIYSIVRSLDFIEWAYNTGHIDKESYMENSNIILEQYKTSVDAFQDKFNGIDAFAQKYGLTDFKLGINRLKQGAVQISSNTNTFALIFQLTQKFNDIANFLYMRTGASTELLVSEIFTFFNELINCVTQCKNIIPIDCEEIQKLLGWMNMIKSKRAADKISLEDEKQVLLDVQIAYDKVNKLLNK